MKHGLTFCIGVMLVFISIAIEAPATGSETMGNQPSPAQTTSAGQIAEEYAVFRLLRNGVLTVRGDVHEGSGFVVDERGIVLTCRHVVENTRVIRVQSSSRTKIEAKVLAQDPAHNIAAILVNMAALRETTVLPLAKPNALGVVVTKGEKILAIGSPAHEKDVPMLVTGIVSSVQPEKILSDAHVSEFHEGGPVINLRGEVVGVVHPDGSIRVDKLEALLGAARQAMITAAPPSAQLLPLEPEMRFPVQALAAFVQSPRFQNFDVWLSEGGENWLLTTARNPRLRGSGSDLYQFQLGRYNVLVMTPILEWYLDEWDTIQTKREEAKRQKRARGASDVGQLDWDWSKYKDKIQSVVHLLAVPDFCQTTTSWLLSGVVNEVTQLKYRTSFSEMSLLCDGREIQPIDRKNFQVKLPAGYGTPKGAFAFAGEYEYPLDAFDQRCCRQLELKIFSEGEAVPNAKVVPAKTTRQVWADFEGYRKVVRER